MRLSRLIPVAAAFGGAFLWAGCRVSFADTFGTDHTLGRVLIPLFNVFPFSISAAALAILAQRGCRLWGESRWASLTLLPEHETFTDYSQVDHFVKRHASLGRRQEHRPCQLLRACFDSVRTKWSSAAASDALNTQLAFMKEEVETYYSHVAYFVAAIPSLGLIGTLYGLSLAILAIKDKQTDQALTYLHLAFDTTMVATVLSIVVGLLVVATKRFDKNILNDAFKKVHQHFVLRIKDKSRRGRR